MPTLEQVTAKYEEFLQRERHALQALDTELQSYHEDYVREKGIVSDGLKDIIPHTQDEILDRLQAVNAKAGTQRDFKRMVADMEEATRVLNVQIEAIEAQHGGKESLAQKWTTLGEQKKKQQSDLIQCNEEISRLGALLEPILDYNSAHADAPVNAGNFQDFKRLRRRDVFFNGDRRVLATYLQSYAGDYSSDASAYQDNLVRRREINTSLRQIQEQALVLENAKIQIGSLQGRRKSPADIVEVVRDTVATMLADDKFSQAFGEIMGPTTRPIMLAVVKAAHLQKIESTLQKRRAAMVTTITQLQQSLAQIRRGGRVAAQFARVNLGNVENQIATQIAGGNFCTRQASAARNAARCFIPGDCGSDSNLNTMLLLWMLSDNNRVDAAFVHHTIGINPDIATQLNLNPDHLVPKAIGIASVAPGGTDALDTFGVAHSFNAGGGCVPDVTPTDVGHGHHHRSGHDHDSSSNSGGVDTHQGHHHNTDYTAPDHHSHDHSTPSYDPPSHHDSGGGGSDPSPSGGDS